MSTQIQYRRGTSTEHQAFTGAVGEITIDTTLNTIRVHDGSTLGGTLLSRSLDTNAAFTHANSAYGHANGSFTHANSAYDKANSGYSQANTALTEANSAYEHANSAYSKANSAYDHANTKFASAGGKISGNVIVTGHITPDVTLTSNIGNATNRFHTLFVGPGSVDVDGIKIQNSAGILTISGATDINFGTGTPSISGISAHANSAYDKANSGYTQANTALAEADGAFLHANSAYDKANSGYSQANTGVTHASAAFTHANSAYGHANAAFTHANSAYDKANSGYTQANTGVTHASAAFTHANSAYGHANSAYDKANSAYNTANTKFASAGGTISGDVVVTGNLTISGTTTTVNANNLTIKDNMIYLNDGATQNAYPDLGVVGAYNNGVYQHTGVFRDQSDNYWKFFDGYLPEPDASVFINTSNSSFRLAGIWVSEAKANVVTANYSSLGTVTTGTWNGTSISTTYTDAKITSVGGQTGAISNTQLLNFLIAVDGSGSGLDADLLDGQQGSYYTNASSINAGTLNSARLPTSGVTAGNYGSASIIPVFAVDTYGRITSVSNTSVAIAAAAVSGLATSATTDTTNATNISSGTLNAARLPSSGVTAGTYASASIVPVFAVDSYGRITAVTNTSIAIAAAAVSGLATSATTDTTNATNITSGTLNAARLPTSGVTATTYTSPTLTVDAYGRVTAAANSSGGGASSGQVYFFSSF